LDLFYCTNAINYTVAVAGVLARRPRPAILLYERRRFSVRPVPGVRQWRISVNVLRLLRLMHRVRPFGTLHVPHHSVASRFEPLLAAATRLAYLDDGLDTLRQVPRNIDLARVAPGATYYTFSDYTQLPSWLDGFDVQRPCALADVLATARQPRIDLTPWDHVFVESPGLDPPALCRALRLDPARVLVVRHPVERKRGPLPEGCAAVPGERVDCEGSLLACAGKDVYCGETMAFLLLAHAGAERRHRLWLQMGAAQWDALVGLPPLRAVVLDGVPGRLGVLEASAAR
jgi:hypothetical protein